MTDDYTATPERTPAMTNPPDLDKVFKRPDCPHHGPKNYPDEPRDQGDAWTGGFAPSR